jgi:hypothetical protein
MDSEAQQNAELVADEAKERFFLLNQRIDDIVAFQKRKGPWYRDTSVVISVAAFLISIVTTVFSWYRSYQQDVTAIQGQLSAVLERATALQRTNFDYYFKLKDDPLYGSVSAVLNQENVQLATQAYSLARTLGENASVTQLTNAAFFLMASDLSIPGKELLDKAAQRADNSVDYVAAMRLLGGLQYKLGNPEAGNEAYAKATRAFEKFPSERNESYENLTQAYTHIYWANMLQLADCNAAAEHMRTAEKFWNKIPGAAAQQQGRPAMTVNCQLVPQQKTP